MNVFNQPSYDQAERIADALERMGQKGIFADPSESPGSKYIVEGNRDAGFFGIVQSADFINGNTLASEIGLTSGTAMESGSNWIKYMYEGKIRFTPLRPFRHSAPWDAIYARGAVYGDGTIGTLPPGGRMGEGLTIEASDNSINTTTQHFLSGTDNSDTVAEIGDTVTLSGWNNSANNGTFTVTSITNSKIVLSGGSLVNESGRASGRIYKTSRAVAQDRKVVVNGLTYKVMLIGGFKDDPFESGASDRGCIGSEWNEIILPLHERAKAQNWNYPAYAGSTEYWRMGFSDFDLRTHHTFGVGNYTWTKEVRDTTTWRRGGRGISGASRGSWLHSWIVFSAYGWRPVLELS